MANEQDEQTRTAPTHADDVAPVDPAVAPSAGGRRRRRTAGGTVDLDELARLEEERRFLLRSIADLEREYAAGDVEQDDYDELMEGYTARAAAVLRTIEHGRAALPPKRRTKPAVAAAWVLGTIVVAIVAGWMLARSSGQRTAGQEMTGGQPADEVSVALTEARALLGQQDLAGAFQRFQRVTELDPGNVEARTYTAWILVLSSGSIEDEALRQTSLDTALDTFAAVIEDDARYADAHCLYAVTAGRFLPEPDLELAKEQGELCLANNPPSGMEGLVQGFLASLDASTDGAEGTEGTDGTEGTASTVPSDGAAVDTTVAGSTGTPTSAP